MRILFLTHSFNSLSQRLYVELTGRGHEVSVEFDINDQVTIEAVDGFRPDLVIAPYLRRAIPEVVWSRHVCLIVHPGVIGDRGPSALDWAIMNGETEWGVTVLQAAAEMDAGDIWASVPFVMRPASKSSLYRREVSDAALEAVLLAVERFAEGTFVPQPLDPSRSGERGTWRPVMKQQERTIDWCRDDTEAVLRKIRAADGFPGVYDRIGDGEFALFDAHAESALRGTAGEILGKRHEAICRATADGAVWITHLRPLDTEERGFKQPAVRALGEMANGLPTIPPSAAGATWRDLWYEERGPVGYIHFPFYNGAMSTDQCRRLEAAYRQACTRDTRVIVLMGGDEFWSNGLHLGVIEAATSPAEESWRNINAMDDLCEAILTTTSHLTVAALRGNAGAGGVFMALAADQVMASSRIVLSPHYKNMGNLYGSEYWTYLLPKRVGAAGIAAVMDRRLPIGARQAEAMGLIDGCLDGKGEGLDAAVRGYAERQAAEETFTVRLEQKIRRRQADERQKPLSAYRAEELARMRLNFFGFDPSYHVARYHFIRKLPLARTPVYLARHRRLGSRPSGATGF